MGKTIINGIDFSGNGASTASQLLYDTETFKSTKEVIDSKQDSSTAINTENIANQSVKHSETADRLTGVTASATELNYVKGVTSSIQTQLNSKAASSHGTHVSYGTSASALGTSSAGSASTVSRSDHVHALPALTSCTGTLSVAKGGTGATTAAAARTNLGLGAAATYSVATSATSGSTELITSGAVYSGLSGKANSSHGNHVPTTQTANNATFLRNDNTWQKVTPANIGAAASSHTHSYLPLGGGTVTDTLVLSKSKDVSPTAYNSPALVVGGTSSQVHLEFDNNEIIAKTNASTVGTLYVNKDGPVLIGNSGCVNTIRGNTTFSQVLWCDGELYIAGSNLLNGEGNLDIQAEGSYIYLRPANDAFRYRFGSSNFVPSGDSTATLGSGNNKWKQLYASTTTISTSDRNKKDNIAPLSDIHKKLFMKLLPVSFMFKDGESGRTHIGFISQDVEASMKELGMTSLDFAGFCKDIKIKTIIEKIPCKDREGKIKKDEEGNIVYYDNEIEVPDIDENGNEQYIYSLRYEEFIGIITYVLQDSVNRLDSLEERLAKLEG